MPTDLCDLLPPLDSMEKMAATDPGRGCMYTASGSGSGGYIALTDDGGPVDQENPSRFESDEVTTSEIGGRTVWWWQATNTEMKALFNTGSTSLLVKVVGFKGDDANRSAAEAAVEYAIGVLSGNESQDEPADENAATGASGDVVPEDLCTLLPPPDPGMQVQSGDASLRCAYNGETKSFSLLNSGFPVNEQDPSGGTADAVQTGTIGDRPVWTWVNTQLSNHSAVVTFNAADVSLSMMVTGGTDDAALLAKAQKLAEFVIGKLRG